MKLLLDPDVDLTTPTRAGLRALAERVENVPTRFGFYSADTTNPNCPRCDRSNQTLHVHVWMLFDADNHITDCEVDL